MARKILFVLAGLLVAFVLFLFWYAATYSMEEARRFEVRVENARGHVLIATQGSAYKDSVVAHLVRQLADREVQVQVVDVADLAAVDTGVWDAIVVLHTWENWKPQPDAAAFIARYPDLHECIVLSTSGSGEEKLVPVDGISSASVLVEAPRDADVLLARVMALL